MKTITEQPYVVKRFDRRILCQIDKKTGEIVERYDSIPAVVEWNEEFTYSCIKQAIHHGQSYKGYYWRWVEV